MSESQNNQPDNQPKNQPTAQDLLNSPEARQAMQEGFKEWSSNQQENRNTGEDSFFGIDVSRAGRIAGETGLVLAALPLARYVDPSLLVGLGYGAAQTARYVLRPDKEPLEYQRTPLGAARHRFEGEEVKNRQYGMDPEKRQKKITAFKGVGTAAVSIVLMAGAPNPLSGSDEQPAAETTVVETSVPDGSAEAVPEPEVANTLSDECPALLTPIPFENTDALTEAEQAEYEEYVTALQTILQSAGYYDAEIDGKAGPVTGQAIYNLKLDAANAGVEGLEDSPTLSTTDCLVLQEAGVWDELITRHLESQQQ